MKVGKIQTYYSRMILVYIFLWFTLIQTTDARSGADLVDVTAQNAVKHLSPHLTRASRYTITLVSNVVTSTRSARQDSGQQTSRDILSIAPVTTQCKGAITSKIKRTIKHKTIKSCKTCTTVAQPLKPSLALVLDGTHNKT